MIVPSHRRTAVLRWVLLLVAAAGLAWAVTIAVSGGILINTSWGRISSRNPIRPFLLGSLALLAYVAAYRQHATEDLRRLALARRPGALGALLAAFALVIGIHWGTFTAAGSDASGYISQAELWLHGELKTVAPEWAHDAPWQDAGWSSAPLGYRPSEISYILVPTYSPGLPIVMALFQAVGGRNAVYYVVPIFGALTVWVTYLFGTRLAGQWAGLLGALLMLTSPAFLIMLVQPMSDVPGAALWVLALWAAWRGGSGSALSAGAAAALAILVRPNIAPLAGIVALVLAVRQSGRVRDPFWFAAALVPAVATIALLNNYLYGSPVRSGYGPLENLYSIDRIWTNLDLYGGWLLETQTPLILLGLAAPFVVPMQRAERQVAILTVIVFPLTLLALYLPYLVFDVWTYLRFLLPAYPPLLAGTAAVIVTLLGRVRQPVAAVAVTAVVVGAIALHGIRLSGAFTLGEGERRYTRVAEYVSQLPERAVFVTLLHSGSIRYYSGRDILRWEVVDPASFDTAIEYLRGRGHDVYVVVDDGERGDFNVRLARTRLARELDREKPVDLGGVRIFAIAGSQQLPPPFGG